MSIELYLNHRRDKLYFTDERIKAFSEQQYQVQNRIASGGNAVVHQCFDLFSGDEYAIKFQLDFNSQRIARFRQEINLLKQVKHRHLIEYIDHGKIIGKTKKGNKEKNILFLIMPKADMNLREYIRTSKKIRYEEYIAQFRGLASALAELHKKAIHRDIKPENILVKGETWLLSDFGLCRYLEPDEKELSRPNEIIGPRYWMSPEALNKAIGNDDEISVISDIFQLCSIFWYIVTGRLPSGVVTKDDWGDGPNQLFSPIFKSLSHNPAKRITNSQDLLSSLENAVFNVA